MNDEIPTQLSDWIDAISAWNCDSDEEDYIIFDGETPIGWLGINGLLSEDKIAYIKMIVLLAQYQNKGVGAYVINQFRRIRKFQVVNQIAACPMISNFHIQPPFFVLNCLQIRIKGLPPSSFTTTSASFHSPQMSQPHMLYFLLAMSQADILVCQFGECRQSQILVSD